MKEVQSRTYSAEFLLENFLSFTGLKAEDLYIQKSYSGSIYVKNNARSGKLPYFGTIRISNHKCGQWGTDWTHVWYRDSLEGFEVFCQRALTTITNGFHYGKREESLSFQPDIYERLELTKLNRK